MANSWFQFKQFTVHHDKCAMKVTTDACLFGAWVASKTGNNAALRYVLDIGAGTGLLSLMMAQKNPGASIDAIELDAEAALQATANIAQSPFDERIQIIHQDVLHFEANKKYDLLISNPPFHEKQLASPDDVKNKAHHDATLTLNDLANTCIKLLAPGGVVSILLPFYRKEEALKLFAEQGLFPTIICDVKQSNGHGFFRTMILFGTTAEGPAAHEIITIRNAEQQYCPEFVTLLKDFYLIF